MQVSKLQFTALSVHQTMCGSRTCDYIQVYRNADLNQTATGTQEVFYSAAYHYYINFTSDGSGNGDGFSATLTYLG